MKTVADQIAEARATGPLEVQVRLTGPNADFPSILATSHFLIVKDGTTDFRTAVGCGPYRLKVFTARRAHGGRAQSELLAGMAAPISTRSS